jgi:hypothetical protein
VKKLLLRNSLHFLRTEFIACAFECSKSHGHPRVCEMVASQIPEIDNLLDAGGPPIALPGSKPAIGAIQDLLRGHGFSRVPSISSSAYGKVTPKTRAALLAFCKLHCPSAIVGNQVTEINKDTLTTMVSLLPVNPIASQVYVTRVLDVPFIAFSRLACLVAIGEGQGAFAAICLNSDRAGLSLGMIQWAQRPGRLNELLKGVPKPRLNQAMGSEAIADKVLALTALKNAAKKISGGVKKSTGKPEDPLMDFALGDWPNKFLALCKYTDVQQSQVALAAKSFETEKGKFDAINADAKSERLVAYLLDVANQFGSASQVLFKNAIDEGGLPSDVKARSDLLIQRVTQAANDQLRTIGEQVIDGKRKWTDAFILNVQKSRTDRATFFGNWDGLADTPF